MLQLAGVAMVVAVDASPIGIRNGAEERTNEANRIVHFTRLKEGIVPTVVLNDKDAYQEKCVDGAKSQSQPNRVIHAKIHGNPQGDEGAEAAEKLADGARGVRLLILGNNRLPVAKTVVDFFDRGTGGIIQE